MNETGTISNNVLFSPEAVHSTRVAAFCDEICDRLGLSRAARSNLHLAALRHHSHADVVSIPVALARDLGIEPQHVEESSWRAILAQYHGRHNSPDQNIRTLAQILEMANLFDEELEAVPYGDINLANLLEQGSAHELVTPIRFVLPHLRRYSRSELFALTKHLPVFPVIAMQLIHASREGELSFERLLELASSDQSLAGQLIKTVSTIEFATAEPIKDLRRAVMHLGTDRATTVLVATAMRPLLTSTSMDDLWNHSLASAKLSATIAEATKICPTGDAYLLGLVHDVGRLLLRLIPRDVSDASAQLVRKGVPSAVAEALICGAAHPEAGGDVLRHWGFPEECAVAVHFHHEPEQCDSLLAAMLYLVEYLTDSEEDLPSRVRLDASLRRVGLEHSDLNRLLAMVRADNAFASLV